MLRDPLGQRWDCRPETSSCPQVVVVAAIPLLPLLMRMRYLAAVRQARRRRRELATQLLLCRIQQQQCRRGMLVWNCRYRYAKRSHRLFIQIEDPGEVPLHCSSRNGREWRCHPHRCPLGVGSKQATSFMLTVAVCNFCMPVAGAAGWRD